MALILSLFLASFLGSWHCAVMCGPIACFVANQGQAKFYHLGRLITYISLGALAGAFGEILFNHTTRGFYLAIITSVTGIIIFSSLVRLNIITIKKTKVSFFKNKINLILIRLFKKWAGRSSFVVGLLTGLLPCGWLLMFVFSVIATHSAISGGFILFIFWLGGLPALVAVSGGMARLINKSPLYHQRIAGIVLIFVAISSIISFAMNINN